MDQWLILAPALSDMPLASLFRRTGKSSPGLLAAGRIIRVASMLHGHATGNPQAPAIVFLHAMATSSWMWKDQVTRLPDFYSLCIDLPGHGLSSAVPWRSFDDAADKVAEIIRAQLPGRRVHVVGLSLGAYVGLTLMSRHAACVDHSILSGINVLPLPNLWFMDLLSYLMAPLLKTGFGAKMNTKALNIPTDQLEGYSQSLRQVSRQAFISAGRDASRFSTPANIADIATPTLLLAGEREHILVHNSTALLANMLPNAIARWAPNAGHGWPAELPGLFAATVRQWCSDRALPAELLASHPLRQAWKAMRA
ncbi:alpha/beta fold hydrolase [Asticcacaulis sp. AC466]|uniref:alpha/beta fold hydrolase n=1 Tax=Asticcacaulis sp. AC466 TaxID=1282362 RepID=UPI0009E0763F|nr:alpha/beta hydrolase [Asticcacaulis sp. AC466]